MSYKRLNNFKSLYCSSGVAGGEGQVEERAPGRRPWGRISTLLRSFKNMFKQKFRPKYA